MNIAWRGYKQTKWRLLVRKRPNEDITSETDQTKTARQKQTKWRQHFRRRTKWRHHGRGKHRPSKDTFRGGEGLRFCTIVYLSNENNNNNNNKQTNKNTKSKLVTFCCCCLSPVNQDSSTSAIKPNEYTENNASRLFEIYPKNKIIKQLKYF